MARIINHSVLRQKSPRRTIKYASGPFCPAALVLIIRSHSHYRAIFETGSNRAFQVPSIHGRLHYMVHYFYLTLAIITEVVGTTCMKLSNGFANLWPSVGMVVFYTVSFGLLTLTLKKLDVGLAYAVWSGLGTALIAFVGILYFKEPATVLKLGSIGLIVLGVIGLHLSGSH